MARIIKLPKGQVVFRQGDECPGLYVVAEGSIKVYKTAPTGKEHILHFVGPGMTFAEVAAIGGFECPAFAEAVEDSRCVLLPKTPFARAMREDHNLCLQLMGSMAFWVRHLVGLMEDIVLRDAAGRLAKHLLEVSGGSTSFFELPTMKKDLASHLNLTSETFSRTLKRLEAASLIESQSGGGMRIANREGLAEIADGVYPLL